MVSLRMPSRKRRNKAKTQDSPDDQNQGSTEMVENRKEESDAPRETRGNPHQAKLRHARPYTRHGSNAFLDRLFKRIIIRVAHI